MTDTEDGEESWYVPLSNLFSTSSGSAQYLSSSYWLAWQRRIGTTHIAQHPTRLHCSTPDTLALVSRRLFTSAQLEYTASRDHGISVDEEKRLRSEGANFIHEVGKKLRMYVTFFRGKQFAHN